MEKIKFITLIYIFPVPEMMIHGSSLLKHIRQTQFPINLSKNKLKFTSIFQLDFFSQMQRNFLFLLSSSSSSYCSPLLSSILSSYSPLHYPPPTYSSPSPVLLGEQDGEWAGSTPTSHECEFNIFALRLHHVDETAFTNLSVKKENDYIMV